MSAYELLLAAAAGAGALVTLAGILWWLVRPRVDQYARTLVRAASQHSEQLAPGGDVHDNTERAAKALEELPEVRQRLEEVAKRAGDQLADIAAWRVTVERRLGLFEQALVAMLGDELKRRLETTDNRS